VDRGFKPGNEYWDTRGGDGAIATDDVVHLRDMFGDSCQAAP
jgi:hypothetical protein